MKPYPKYKDSGEQWLGQIPEHWEVRRTKYIWQEVTELAKSENESLLSVSQYEGVVPAKNDSRSESIIGYKKVHEDNLVINIMLAWLGGLGVSKYEGVVSPAYCIYKNISGNNSRYLNYLYKTPLYLAEFARHSTGVVPSRWRMYTDDFGRVLTLLPPLAEQEAMVAYLDEQTGAIDKAIQREQAMIDLLEERKQIIIQKAVTKGLNPNAPMKDSGIDWIGEIPEGWKVRRFKYLYRTCTGITFTKADLVEEGYPVLSYGQVHSKQNKSGTLNEDLIKRIPYSLIKGKDQCLTYNGDFIFADTSEDFEGCGNNIYVDTDYPIYAGYHTIIAKRNNNECGKYLGYLFASRPWRGQIRTLVNGVKVFSVTQGILKSSSVLLPPVDEQEKIAAFLDRKVGSIDKAIAAKNRVIALLQERKQIIISEVVTGKIKIS